MSQQQVKNNTLFRNEVYVLTTMIIGTALKFLVSMQYARILSPTLFGEFVLTLQILDFLKPFNQWGVFYALTYYVPYYLENNAMNYLRGFLIWMWRRVFTLSGVAIIIGIIMAAFGYYLFFLRPETTKQFHLFFFLIWLIPLKVCAGLLNNLLNANKNYLAATISTRIIFFLLLNLFLFTIYINLGNIAVPLVWVIAAYCLSLVLIILVQQVVLVKNFRRTIIRFKPKYNIPDWNKKSNQMFLMGSVLSAINMVDMLMLKLLGKNSYELGILAAIFAVLLPLVLVNQVIKIVISPLIAPIMDHKEYPKLQKIINNTNLYKTLVLICVAALLIVFGKTILGLFGKEYIAYYPQFLLAMLGAVIYSLFDFSQMILTYGEHVEITDKLLVAQLGCIILLDVLLIPAYQLTGAIAAIVSGEVMISVLSLYYVKKFHPIKPLSVI
ncbi:oligosaccharide flippase family protein [Legionella spiritensis]|uniref:oligosaccharide flippase family protein n=1 Tax=Legionella spiritensis TaxID=452 RepID=UPI000F6BF469|nr:oligosaccharide flippase family protein [Legionella spiritensis]VEG89785.1 Polysaccharide biosynthesis protein [Legionella spiritensis]